MPKIMTHNRQVAASGGVASPRATADHFGGGKGLQVAGLALERTADYLFEKRQKDELHAVKTGVAKFRLEELKNLQSQFDNNTDPSKSGFTESYQSDYQKRVEQNLESMGLTTDAAKQFYEQSYANMKVDFVGRAIGMEGKARSVYNLGQMKEANMASSQLAALDESNFLQASIDIANSGETIADENLREQQMNIALNGASVAAAGGVLERDPQKLLDDLSGDADYTEYLTPGEKQAYRKKAKAGVRAIEARAKAADSEATAALREQYSHLASITRDPERTYTQEDRAALESALAKAPPSLYKSAVLAGIEANDTLYDLANSDAGLAGVQAAMADLPGVGEAATPAEQTLIDSLEVYQNILASRQSAALAADKKLQSEYDKVAQSALARYKKILDAEGALTTEQAKDLAQKAIRSSSEGLRLEASALPVIAALRQGGLPAIRNVESLLPDGMDDLTRAQVLSTINETAKGLRAASRSGGVAVEMKLNPGNVPDVDLMDAGSIGAFVQLGREMDAKHGTTNASVFPPTVAKNLKAQYDSASPDDRLGMLNNIMLGVGKNNTREAQRYLKSLNLGGAGIVAGEALLHGDRPAAQSILRGQELIKQGKSPIENFSVNMTRNTYAGMDKMFGLVGVDRLGWMKEAVTAYARNENLDPNKSEDRKAMVEAVTGLAIHEAADGQFTALPPGTDMGMVNGYMNPDPGGADNLGFGDTGLGYETSLGTRITPDMVEDQFVPTLLSNGKYVFRRSDGSNEVLMDPIPDPVTGRLRPAEFDLSPEALGVR